MLKKLFGHELDPSFEELKKAGAEIRFFYGEHNPMGKISKIGSRFIYLQPHIVWENLPDEHGKFVQRCKIETEYALPLPKKGTIPQRVSDGYIQKFVNRFNYFSSKGIRDPKIKQELFQYLPFPSKEEISIIEGRMDEKVEDSYKGPKRIGFRIGEED